MHDDIHKLPGLYGKVIVMLKGLKELLRLVSPEIEDKVGKVYSKARNWVHKDIDN